MQEIKKSLQEEIEILKNKVNCQKMKKDEENKIISELNVQEQYKQFLLSQKSEKNKEFNQISSKNEELYLDVFFAIRIKLQDY